MAGGQQAVPGPAGAGCQQKEVPVSRLSQRLKFYSGFDVPLFKFVNSIALMSRGTTRGTFSFILVGRAIF